MTCTQIATQPDLLCLRQYRQKLIKKFYLLLIKRTVYHLKRQNFPTSQNSILLHLLIKYTIILIEFFHFFLFEPQHYLGQPM